MIEINKEKFERIVLAATSSNADVFNSMGDSIQLSIQKVEQKFLGASFAIPENLLPEFERFVCMDAFYNAIPMLDIVLTSTGFGVVNNQNVAPASRERVQALRDLVRKSADDAEERIIEGLILQPAWGDLPCARMLITSLFYTSSCLKDFAGQPFATRLDLLSAMTRIYTAEEKIRRTVSSEFFEYLLSQIRNNRLSDHEILLVWTLRKSIGLFIANSQEASARALDEASNLLENNIDRFPIYKNSEAYQVKHFEFYKNAKEDSCVFWG